MRNSIYTLLLLLPLGLLSQNTVIRKNIELSSSYDVGQAVFPNGEGYIVFGSANQAGSTTLSDLYMLKLDHNGNQIAVQRYGSATVSESLGRSVLSMPDGGWLLAGNSGTSGYLLRLNAAGNTMWSNTYSYVSNLNDIAALPDGSFIALGKLPLSGKTAAMRFSNDGQVLWQNSYTGSLPKRICTSRNGGAAFLLTDRNILKIRASDGGLVWNQFVPAPNYREGEGYLSFLLNDLISLNDGRIAMTGYLISDEITTLYSAFYTAVWSESGEEQWTKFQLDEETGFDYNEAYSLTWLPNSRKLLVAGVKSGSATVLRLSETGNFIDSVNLNIPGYVVRPVMNKIGANYVATGGALAQIQNINTFFYRSAGNALRDEEDAENEYTNAANEALFLYPNPAGSVLHAVVQSDKTQEIRVQVYDLFGRLIVEHPTLLNPGENRISLQIGDVPRGIYRLAMPGLDVRGATFVKD